MLSQSTINIIKSTVPVLEEKGVEITSRFYSNLFRDYPELLNIFNHANQKKGRQQTALANTLYAAATHIDKLEDIIPAVVQIAHKHRSLQVKPEHYPIVGEYLLKAMKEVLGDIATDDVISAWSDAYSVIAQVFIETEENMYQEAKRENGWEDFKTFTVVDKVVESDVITSFYLKPADHSKLPSFQPGQYVTVRVKPLESNYFLNRQYSLSQAPGKDTFRISVKRETGEFNGAVSNYLHNSINIHDELELTAPAGNFTLCEESDKPIYFFAGGVGITPLLSMFQHIHNKATSQKVHFIQAAVNGKVQGFKNEIIALANNNPNATVSFIYESPTEGDKTEGGYVAEGYVSRDILQQIGVDNKGEYYVCGPTPFMKTVITILLEMGVSQENIHYEFFGPAIDLETYTTEVVK